MALRVKAYLLLDVQQGKQEIRRFMADGDVGKNYMTLREKISNIFPSLLGKAYSLSWKDSENDDIAMSSDEELLEAVESAGAEGLLKIYIQIEPDPSDPASKISGGIIHPQVICDSCNSEVRGYRYKCLQCENYDLCHSCNQKDPHPNHDMLKLTLPLQAHTLHSYNIPHVGRAIRRFFGGPGSPHHSPSRGGDGGGHHRRRFRTSSLHCQRCSHKHSSPAKDGAGPSDGQGTNGCKDSAGPSGPQDCGGMQQAAELLAAFGQTFKDLMEPAGLDSSMHEDGCPIRSGAKSAVNKTPKAEFKIPGAERKVETNGTGAGEAVVNGEQESGSEEGEWTVLNKHSDGINHSQETASKHDTASSSSSYEKTSAKKVPHSNPVMDNALKFLTDMGFENLGDTLQRLLEDTNGDVVKVLDALLHCQNSDSTAK